MVGLTPSFNFLTQLASPDSRHVEPVEEVLNACVGRRLEGVRIFELENTPGHRLDDVGVTLLDVEEGLTEL